MQINSDFSRSVRISSDEQHWIASPQSGVERVMLDRIGAEDARATSLVRYARGSSFPRHAHPQGEEILVLAGTFSDDSGDYPAGWYLRNPPGSSHRPHSDEGALIFVKLRQMHVTQDTLRINTCSSKNWQQRADHSVCNLYCSYGEQVSLVRLNEGALLPTQTRGGAEILVLSGALREGSQLHGPSSWIRLAPGENCQFHAQAPDTTVYLKTGHLGDLPFIE
nr:cupin domain-containing protein [Delftia acidovorans]